MLPEMARLRKYIHICLASTEDNWVSGEERDYLHINAR